jgi:iron complex transport system substrate-binding protein
LIKQKTNWASRNWKKFTASALLAAAIIFFPICDARSQERIVVLAPAAADILRALGAGGSVVGVTRVVREFPDAAQVGSHLNPSLERIASLRPTLLIGSALSNPEMAGRLGADWFLYAPENLADILRLIRSLADRLGKSEEGEKLAASLEKMLEDLRPPRNRPTVLFERRSSPLAVARRHDSTVIMDLLERAGMEYALPDSSGILSAEYLLAHQPDYYLYQEGPMNRNPVPPHQRNGWEHLRSCVWKVDEFAFSRANTEIFQRVVEINAILDSDSPCDEGRRFYGE